MLHKLIDPSSIGIEEEKKSSCLLRRDINLHSERKFYRNRNRSREIVRHVGRFRRSIVIALVVKFNDEMQFFLPHDVLTYLVAQVRHFAPRARIAKLHRRTRYRRTHTANDNIIARCVYALGISYDAPTVTLCLMNLF